MRHRKKKVTLDRKVGPRTALLKNLAMQVILYEAVKTSDAKARAVAPIVERAITRGKLGTLAARRLLLSQFSTEHPVKKIFEVLAPRYKDRVGGYTRILKIGRRQGDAGEIVMIELV